MAPPRDGHKRRRLRRYTIATGTYRVAVCEGDHIHVSMPPDPTAVKSGEYVFDPEEAYEFAHAILRGYDEAVGIGPPPRPMPEC